MIEGGLHDLHSCMEIFVRADVLLHAHGTFIFAQGSEDRGYACHHQCTTEDDRARCICLLTGYFVEQAVEVGGMFLPLAVGQRDFRRRLLKEVVHLQYLQTKFFVESDIVFFPLDGGCRTIFPSCPTGVDGETGEKSVLHRVHEVG